MNNWLTILLIFVSSYSWAQGAFRDNLSPYDSTDAYNRRWEKIMYYPIKNQRDTAYYDSQNLCYIKVIRGDSATFHHYYANGYLHVAGTGLRAKNGKIKPREGVWNVYFPDGQIKEHITFRNQRGYGHYYKLDSKGDTLRSRYYRQKLLYGFALGWIQNFPRLRAVENSTSQLSSIGNLGFMLGISFYYKTSPGTMLRAELWTSFHEHRLLFEDSNEQMKFSLEPAFLELPLHYLVRLFPKQPLYVVGGATFSKRYPDAKAKEEPKLKLKSFDTSLDVGVAYDINLQFVHIMPEIKYARALVNFKREDNTKYAQPIQGIFRDQLSLILHFF